jgi:membrane protease YdiL (CAAX protease family)
MLPLWSFLAISAAFSWTMWLWPVSAGSYVFLNFRGWQVNWPASNIKFLIGNCLPGLIALVWTSVQGKQYIADLLSTVLAWRVHPAWYILSIAIPSGVFLTSLCTLLIHSRAELVQPPKMLLYTSLLSVPFGPVWEEIAWRAFALRKLQNRYSQVVSALIIGVYWAVWHVPLWLITLNYLTFKLLVIVCINLVSWSVISSYLYNRSGQGLPVVMLLHATYFTVQNLVFASVSKGNIRLIPIVALLSACLAAILAGRLAAALSRERAPSK